MMDNVHVEYFLIYSHVQIFTAVSPILRSYEGETLPVHFSAPANNK